MQKIFALVDCNNFYVSCERAFNPGLEGKPVIVLSNNDGCVISRSNEAKALGVEMGIPVFQCEYLFRKHKMEVYSSNYTLYADMSRRVMDTLAEFTPEMEIYSIDEAFLSLAGFSSSNLVQYGRLIRTTVMKWTGIPVSIGIGTTKTLAKIANKIAKRNPEYGGVLDITGHPRPDSLLDKIAVSDIWGIGRNLASLLGRNGIYTALQLKNAPDAWIKKHMSVSGLRTAWELRGTPCISLDQAPISRKGILSSRSFGRPVETLSELKEAIATYVSRAAEKLRAQESASSFVSVFLTTGRFKKDNEHHTDSASSYLPEPSFYTPELISYAWQNLERIFKQGCLYKKAGVMLTGIVPQTEAQLNLLVHSRDNQKKRSLMKVMDCINTRWGRDTLQYAAAGTTRNWKMRQSKRSPRFTTNWSEIPVVKASFPRGLST